jgi:hypothetical protein
MTSQKEKVVIKAEEAGYADLDFPEVVVNFSNYLNEKISGQAYEFELDLTGCVLTYSQTSLFLNLFLQYFSTFEIDQTKFLEIVTTDNYITKDLTCYQFFRTTKIISDDNCNPTNVANEVNAFCIKEGLVIQIRVVSYEDRSSKEQQFIFGEFKCL